MIPNDEVEKPRKEAATAYYKVQSENLPGNHKT
jgi:hypothetical protein